MATAPSPFVNRHDLETALIQKSWTDAAFRKEVVSNPKGMLETYLGQRLPEQVQIFIHEEDANTLHFSIPPGPSATTELSEEDLDRVAGRTEIGFATGIVLSVMTVGVASAAGAGSEVPSQRGGAGNELLAQHTRMEESYGGVSSFKHAS